MRPTTAHITATAFALFVSATTAAADEPKGKTAKTSTFDGDTAAIA